MTEGEVTSDDQKITLGNVALSTVVSLGWRAASELEFDGYAEGSVEERIRTHDYYILLYSIILNPHVCARSLRLRRPNPLRYHRPQR